MKLVEPYGGSLVNLLVSPDEREELMRHGEKLPLLQLSARALCDLELLATGAFSPIDTFLGRADYIRVLEEMRLANGVLFPIPITLPTNDVSGLKLDQELALRNSKNNLIAIIRVSEIYEREAELEERAICGPYGEHHPLALEMHLWGRYCISGELKVLNIPMHYDFPELRRTPAEIRLVLESLGNSNVVAFHTQTPMHRSHEALTKRAVREVGASLLLHPAVGVTKPGDIDHYTRIRAHKALVDNYYNGHPVVLSLLPLAMRMAGPREALLHAIIRRNHGANYFMVGRDHASPGLDPNGNRYYEPSAARDLAVEHSKELGVSILPYEEMIYMADADRYEQVTAIPRGARVLTLSDGEVEEYLIQGKALPDWFTRKETAEILAAAHPPRYKQGFCIWFTGLPSAGKSTIAEFLAVMLMEQGRQATVLDGDVVRTHLSKGLGFSHEDRDTNILRIGFVASEITRHHGVVICAAVSPYRITRDQVRGMMRSTEFIEVFVSTPVEVCEQRDIKGHYRRARAGELKGFTGVDDPYEPPLNAEVVLNTVASTPEQNARHVVSYLMAHGLLASPAVRQDDHSAVDYVRSGI